MEINISNIINENKLEYKKFKIIAESSDNIIVLLIDNSNKKSILRISKREKSASIKFEFEINEFLIKNNFKVPRWEKIYLNNNHISVLMNYINGNNLNLNEITLNDVEKSSELLAKIHDISKGIKFTKSNSRDIFTEINRVDNYINIFEKLENGKEFLSNIDVYKNWTKKEFKEECLIHNDFRPHNVIKTKHEYYLIDLDWACIGPSIKDLAHSLVEWSYPDGAEGPNQKIINTFLSKYNLTRNYNLTLDKTLLKWMAFSCLSDTCTYLCDLIEEGEFSTNKISSYMYKKFKYFNNYI